jgi:hypothetical protein
MGLYSLAWTLAMTLGPGIGLLAYAKAGPQILWLACGLVGASSAALLGRFRSR